MSELEYIELARDCEAISIPAGEHVTLPAGTPVYLMQSLGGSFTVQARSHGGLFRIAGRDADAIGKPVPEEAEAGTSSGGIEEQVWAALRTCYDPEIPVNIVDLGLVYDTRIAPQGNGHRVDVKMTLTAPGCGMGAAIAADAEDKIRAIAGVEDASVEVVWDPPWNPHMISEEGRKILGVR